MFQNYKGFTFIEVMFAIAILAVAIAASTSIFILVLKERQTVAEQLAAYEILHNAFEERNAFKQPPDFLKQTIIKNGTVYTLHLHKSDRNVHICINWEGRNGRAYEECGVVRDDSEK